MITNVQFKNKILDYYLVKRFYLCESSIYLLNPIPPFPESIVEPKLNEIHTKRYTGKGVGTYFTPTVLLEIPGNLKILGLNFFLVGV